MSGRRNKVGRDSVEPTNERSEASRASVSGRHDESPGKGHDGDARSARAAWGGKQGSTESRPNWLWLLRHFDHVAVAQPEVVGRGFLAEVKGPLP